jgi:predicted esterase
MIRQHRYINGVVVRLLIAGLVITAFFGSHAYCAEDEENESPKTKGFWGINYSASETEDKQGMILTYIFPGGPADRAGLKVDDCIIEINGQIVNEESFQKWVDESVVGDELSLTVMRAGERIKTTIVLGDRTIEMSPKGYTRHYPEMKSLGTYIAMLPPDYEESEKSYPLCIILHGRGSTELGHGILADQLGRDGIIYIAPRYSYPFVDIFIENQQEGWSGYPPYEFDEDSVYLPLVENLSVDWIFTCVEDARKHYRVAGDKVFILGHSQGAFFAIACAALHPELVESYFAYAPYVPDVYVSTDVLAGLKEHRVKVYLAHGTEDEVLDMEESERAETAMRQAGIECTFKKFKAGHSFTTDVFSFAREWLNAEVRTNKN